MEDITGILKPEIIGKSNICRRCGRKLKNPKSIELGFGNTCYKKFTAESNYKPLFEVRKNEPGTKLDGWQWCGSQAEKGEFLCIGSI